MPLNAGKYKAKGRNYGFQKLQGKNVFSGGTSKQMSLGSRRRERQTGVYPSGLALLQQPK